MSHANAKRMKDTPNIYTYIMYAYVKESATAHGVEWFPKKYI